MSKGVKFIQGIRYRCRELYQRENGIVPKKVLGGFVEKQIKTSKLRSLTTMPC